MVKQTVNKLAKALKSNRILMIVCVFVVMGLAVALIQFLQEKTLERFTSAFKMNGTTLDEAQHGVLHAECNHKNTDGTKHTCGHAHTANAATAAADVDLGNNNAVYTVNAKGVISVE